MDNLVRRTYGETKDVYDVFPCIISCSFNREKNSKEKIKQQKMSLVVFSLKYVNGRREKFHIANSIKQKLSVM